MNPFFENRRPLWLPLAALATLLLFPSAGLVSSASAGVEGCVSELCGDLDGNGSTKASDAQLLLKCAVGQSVELSCTTGQACWDLDGDGICTLKSEDMNEDEVCDALDCQGPHTLAGLVNQVRVNGNITSTGKPECITAACELGQTVLGCGHANLFPETLHITSLLAEQVEEDIFGCQLCGYIEFIGPVINTRGFSHNATVQAICAD